MPPVLIWLGVITPAVQVVSIIVITVWFRAKTRRLAQFESNLNLMRLAGLMELQGVEKMSDHLQQLERRVTAHGIPQDVPPQPVHPTMRDIVMTFRKMPMSPETAQSFRFGPVDFGTPFDPSKVQTDDEPDVRDPRE